MKLLAGALFEIPGESSALSHPDQRVEICLLIFFGFPLCQYLSCPYSVTYFDQGDDLKLTTGLFQPCVI